MQKLKFINGNGVEIDLTDKVNFGIIAWEGFSADGLNIQSQQVPFQDGGVFLDALMEQRELSVTVAINAKGDLEKRYRLRRELISVLNPKLGEGVLIYTDNYLSKQIHVIPEIPLFDTNNSNDSGTPKVSCSFTACNPYWEDLEDTVEVFQIGTTKAIFNNGDLKTPVIIKLIGDGVNPKIQNITTNKIVKYNKEISGPLTINTNIGKKEVYTENFDFKRVLYGGRLRSVIYSRAYSKFIAVGDMGQVLFSNDGITWEMLDVNIASDFYGICEANQLNLLVAVGSGGSIITSPDGITWTIRTSNTTKNLRGVIYSTQLNLLVAVGADGTIITSSNGIDWTIRSSGVLTYLYAVGYSNNLLVAVGASGTIITSPDGITWTSRSIAISNNFLSIAYSNSLKLFVIGGSSGLIYTSPDGITWISRTSEATDSLNSMYFVETKNMFITSDYRHFFVSYDGISWARINYYISYGNEGADSITYSVDLNLFIAVGDVKILSSNNLNDWYLRNRPVNLQTVCYSEELSLYIGIYTGSNWYKSTDGINWIRGNYNVIPNGYYFDSLYIKEWGLFVVVGSQNNVITSPDGITWTTRLSNISELYSLSHLCYSKELNLCVAISGNGGLIYTSSDGITWTARTSGVTIQFMSIAYSRDLNLFVISALNKRTLLSNDGINWNVNVLPITLTNIGSLAYSNYLKYFIALTSVKIWKSYDGVHWIEYTSNGDTLIYYVEDLHLFISLGDGIHTSPDGITWTKVYNSSGRTLVYSKKQNQIVTVGSGVLISNSTTKQNAINYISRDSDLTFDLVQGENKLALMSDSGTVTATLTFRQKYIGV